MGSMKETMDFLNSFMPEACYAGLMIFALIFWLKFTRDNKETEKLDAEKN